MAVFFGSGDGGASIQPVLEKFGQAGQNAGSNLKKMGNTASTWAPPKPSTGGGGVGLASAPAPAPAPTYTPIAAPAAAAAAPTVRERPWLDAEFNKYFGRIQQDFADRGLLDSTNKLAPMKELADAMANRYAQEQRVDEQNSIQNAMRLWEMLTSGALQQGQLALSAGLSPTLNMPAQPNLFSNIWNTSYLPPSQASSGPTGDAPVLERPVGVDASRGEVIPTYGMRYDNVRYRDERADAAADRAIQQAYLKLAQDAAAKDSEGDPWESMASMVRENRYLGKVEPGNNQHPTDLFESLEAQFGIDIEAEIRAGNPRAIALVQSAYDDPTVAKAVIDRVRAGGTWKKPAGDTYPKMVDSAKVGLHNQSTRGDAVENAVGMGVGIGPSIMAKYPGPAGPARLFGDIGSRLTDWWNTPVK